MRFGYRLKTGGFVPIRWKLIIYFFVFMLLIIFIGLYINLSLKISSRFFKTVLEENNRLEVIGEKIHTLQYYTESFLTDENGDDLQRYSTAYAKLNDEVAWIRDYIGPLQDEEKYYRFFDLMSCLNRILRFSERAVLAKRNEEVEAAYDYGKEMETSVGVTQKYLASLINSNTTLGSQRYDELTEKSGKIESYACLLALAIGLLSIAFCINFSMGITQPLYHMIKNAEKIGAGDFKVGKVVVESNDELQIIAEVFNRMSGNIHDLFMEIQKKVKLERQLKEEKMRNLEIANLLRESELQNLQAQINPHFLYNTLNAVSQVAIIEGAKETGDLIKAMARLLRYNLRSLERPVTVQEELDNIREYMHIMRIRYGERVDCQIKISGHPERFLIPCMTLQPLVENSFIHGISQLTNKKGIIKVQATEGMDEIVIVIEDNGRGMEEEKLREILASKDYNKSRSSGTKCHVTGLGLSNIMKRLKLFYKKGDLLTISSRTGEGTKVTLRLPFVEEEGKDVQFVNRG